MTVRSKQEPVSSKTTEHVSARVFLSFCVLLTVLLLTVTAGAQQPKKLRTMGYLSVTDPVAESTRSEAIRLALRERGYIEGQSIAIDYRYGEGRRDRRPDSSVRMP